MCKKHFQNISFSQGTFEYDFPLPQVGYVGSLEGKYIYNIR